MNEQKLHDTTVTSQQWIPPAPVLLQSGLNSKNITDRGNLLKNYLQNCVQHFRTPTKMAATAELNLT
jgi:hypothetical protein